MRRVVLGLLSASLLFMASLAAVTAFAADDHLKCYKVKDPVRLRGPAPAWLDLTGPEFGSESCKIVGGFRLYCTPVTKTVTGAIERNTGSGFAPFTPDPVAGADTLAQGKICYKIKCTGNAVPNPDDAHAVFDQFGNREVRKFRPFMLCGPAEHASRFVIPVMDGSQEVPANGSSAVGQCTGILRGLSFEMTCTHDVVAPTAAHVHVGAAGVNGGIVFPFASAASPMTGTWNMTLADLGDLLLGNLYVNVHSANCGTCPGGEIRGQWEQAP